MKKNIVVCILIFFIFGFATFVNGQKFENNAAEQEIANVLRKMQSTPHRKTTELVGFGREVIDYISSTQKQKVLTFSITDEKRKDKEHISELILIGDVLYEKVNNGKWKKGKAKEWTDNEINSEAGGDVSVNVKYSSLDGDSKFYIYEKVEDKKLRNSSLIIGTGLKRNSLYQIKSTFFIDKSNGLLTKQEVNIFMGGRSTKKIKTYQYDLPLKIEAPV